MEKSEKKSPRNSHHSTENPEKSSLKATLLCTLPLIVVSLLISLEKTSLPSSRDEALCEKTCRIRVVESIPMNVSFPDWQLPPSTYFAWKRIIEKAESHLQISAYKSSLQGKHVLGSGAEIYSAEGDAIFRLLQERGGDENLRIQMVENYPPKDKGDNADGEILQANGHVERRYLNMKSKLGSGTMHSKFLLADDRHFYLGSANLDWRSLNQKMELGLLVEDCACLGQDLRNVYESYWKLTYGKKDATPSLYNKERPLSVAIGGAPSQIYIATSPKQLNSEGRTWDLDAILSEIDGATEFLHVHVMDYFPMKIYRQPRTMWPVIDEAIRRAIMRGVEVRILAAALHYPEMGVRALKSLEALNGIHANSSVQVKIFKVPNIVSGEETDMVISRERRTHNKFMVTESAVLVGTSNWSGDYFEGGTTGAAVVVKQTGEARPMVEEMKDIFRRDWESAYAHDLDEYYEGCIVSTTASFCESKKDPRLFASHK